MKIKFIVLFALTLCLFQVGVAQTDSNPDEPGGYLIGPGDELTIKVLGEPEFDTVTRVDNDGKFQVTFFEERIQAQCRTAKEVRADVVQLLAKYLRNPQTSVSITEKDSRPPATIYGQVKSPQQFTLYREVNLLEILSIAGGPTEKAGGLIQVTRTKAPLCSSEDDNWLASENSFPSRHYSLSSLRLGGADSNPIIYPGDIVVVPEAPPVYVVGEVNVIGREILIPENGLPLTQAISQAGGPRREAKTKDIRIYRQVAGSPNPQIISANYDLIRKGEQRDIMLEPYDIIEVDKSKKSFAQILLDLATGGLTTLAQTTLPQRVLY